MLLEQLLKEYIGDSPVIYMVAGLTILILTNLIVTILLAHKSKDDDINFEVMPDFIQPLLMYGAFLMAGEGLIIGSSSIPILHEAFRGVQMISFALILVKYFVQIYKKLKLLGMETSEQMDRQIEGLDEKVETLLGSNKQNYTKPITPIPTTRIPNDYVEGRLEESEK